MRKKKAQAAMEFIMTYGWAILAVTVVIGALVYFGIFSPERFLPEGCTFPAEISCVGKARTTLTTITFVVQNNVGHAVTVDVGDISYTGDCVLDADGGGDTINAIVDGGVGDPITLQNAETATVVLDCDSVAGRMRQEVTLQYTDSYSGLKFPVTGTITSNAQA